MPLTFDDTKVKPLTFDDSKQLTFDDSKDIGPSPDTLQSTQAIGGPGTTLDVSGSKTINPALKLLLDTLQVPMRAEQAGIRTLGFPIQKGMELAGMGKAPTFSQLAQSVAPGGVPLGDTKSMGQEVSESVRGLAGKTAGLATDILTDPTTFLGTGAAKKLLPEVEVPLTKAQRAQQAIGIADKEAMAADAAKLKELNAHKAQLTKTYIDALKGQSQNVESQGVAFKNNLLSLQEEKQSLQDEFKSIVDSKMDAHRNELFEGAQQVPKFSLQQLKDERGTLFSELASQHLRQGTPQRLRFLIDRLKYLDEAIKDYVPQAKAFDHATADARMKEIETQVNEINKTLKSTPVLNPSIRETLSGELSRRGIKETGAEIEKLLTPADEQEAAKIAAQRASGIAQIVSAETKPSFLSGIKEVGPKAGAIKEAVKQTIGLPRYILGNEAIDKAIDMKVHGVAEEAFRVWKESGLNDVRDEAKRLPEATRMLLGGMKDGLWSDKVLNPQEKKILDGYRKFSDWFANYAGLKKGDKIENYLRHYWTPESIEAAKKAIESGDFYEADIDALSVGEMLSHVKTPRTGAVGYQIDLVRAFDQLTKKVIQEKLLKPVLDEAKNVLEKSTTNKYYKQAWFDFALGKPTKAEKIMKSLTDAQGKVDFNKVTRNLINNTYTQVLGFRTDIGLFHLPQMLNYALKHPWYWGKGVLNISKENPGLIRDLAGATYATIKNLSLKAGREASQVLSNERVMQSFEKMAELDAGIYGEMGRPVMGALKSGYQKIMHTQLSAAMYLVRGSIYKGARMEYIAKNLKHGMELTGEFLLDAEKYGINEARKAAGGFGRLETPPFLNQIPGARMFLGPIINQANLLVDNLVREDWPAIQGMYKDKALGKKASMFFKNDLFFKYLLAAGAGHVGYLELKDNKDILSRTGATILSRLNPLNLAGVFKGISQTPYGDLAKGLEEVSKGKYAAGGERVAKNIGKMVSPVWVPEEAIKQYNNDFSKWFFGE